MNWLIVMTIVILQVMITSSTSVYYVLPNNVSNTSCPSQYCATVSQYLQNNSILSYVSDVKFYFLAGEHLVTSNIVIRHVNNFEFIGVTNGSSSPALICQLPVSVFVLFSRNVTISNLRFNKCGGNIGTITSRYTTSDRYDYSACLLLFLCSGCAIRNSNIFHQAEYGIVGINVIGDSKLENITIFIHSKFSSVFCAKGILFLYINSNSYSNHGTLSITELLIIDNDPDNVCTLLGGGIDVELKQNQYNMRIILSRSYFDNIKFSTQALINVFASSYTNSSLIIKQCTFQRNINKHTIGANTKSLIAISMNSINLVVIIKDCLFQANNVMSSIINLEILETSYMDHFRYLSNVTIVKCGFVLNTSPLLYFEAMFLQPHKYAAVIFIKEVHFFGSVIVDITKGSMITIHNMVVHLIGEVVFARNFYDTVLYLDSCDAYFHNNITFQGNTCEEVIKMKSSSRLSDSSIKLAKHVTVEFVQNTCANQLIVVIMNDHNKIYPFCLFQYLGTDDVSLTKFPYKVYFDENVQQKVSLRSDSSINYYTSDCQWIALSLLFNGLSSSKINGYAIEAKDPIRQHLLLYRHIRICSCSNDGHYNCSNNMLGSVSPGQTLQADLCVPYNPTMTVLYAETHHSLIQDVTCTIMHQAQLTNVIRAHHRKFNFTISSKHQTWCQLFLTAEPHLYKYYDVFTVELLPCPLGFVMHNGVCDCDPILSSREFYITCNIEKATVKRPTKSWMHAERDNHSSYTVSSKCPRDYCVPGSSEIDLINPDLQCQFKRSDILCSQCQHGLSMVFGSSRCIKCTNIHVLITLVIIVAGIVLVVFLYLLNLTVTNGTINGIIFYANIVSINDSIFLVNGNVFKPLKVFISFTNLDLGIETCYYNGMDSYAKMWFNLFFPLYLILIAIFIIISSRYSYRIQRLTHTRSLPVLATLFLLSYTGILRAVSVVLFSYSTITHLPSGHQQLVWSIDASVPLFGVKFTFLFIACLVLFLLLIPFNIILLFTRYLLKFSIISRFKPILDAFYGPYKDNYYYWIGVQITFRNLLFILNALEMRVRLVISAMLLVCLTTTGGYFRPYKTKLLNIQELLLLINLTMLYGVSYQNSKEIFSITTNIMMAVAFIHFSSVVLHHLLTHACHCDIARILLAIKNKLHSYLCEKEPSCVNDHNVLNIPECAYDYTKYQGELISDDFK